MKYLVIAAIVLTIQTIAAFGQECKKLDAGRYFFKHKTKGYKNADFILTINADSYFVTKDGQDYPKGEIKWWSDNCMFRLNSEENQIMEKTKLSNGLVKRD